MGCLQLYCLSLEPNVEPAHDRVALAPTVDDIGYLLGLLFQVEPKKLHEF